MADVIHERATPVVAAVRSADAEEGFSKGILHTPEEDLLPKQLEDVLAHKEALRRIATGETPLVYACFEGTRLVLSDEPTPYAREVRCGRGVKFLM